MLITPARLWHALLRRARLLGTIARAWYRRVRDVGKGPEFAQARFIDIRYRPYGGTGHYAVPFLGRPLVTPWLPMLRTQLRSFFVLGEYAFTLPTNPVIVDAGANLGIASLYFWRRYDPRVLVSLEADPEIYSRYTIPNLRTFDVGARVLNKALWKENREVRFMQTGLDSGFVDPRGGTVVEGVSLDSLIDELGPIDLLKMDIEGGEMEVIPSTRQLDKVQNIFIEIEIQADFLKKPEIILAALTCAGFRYYLRTIIPGLLTEPPAVFERPREDIAYFLNIFGTRN